MNGKLRENAGLNRVALPQSGGGQEWYSFQKQRESHVVSGPLVGRDTVRCLRSGSSRGRALQGRPQNQTANSTVSRACSAIGASRGSCHTRRVREKALARRYLRRFRS